MPDDYRWIPPGAHADVGLKVDAELMSDFADKAIRESYAVGDVMGMQGIADAEGAVPGAALVSGCIALRQTADSLASELYDGLNQLYLSIHSGLATIDEADRENAAGIGQAVCE